MKPDIIVCWPINCDYPLWRKFVKDNRERFEKVIVIFTNLNNPKDLREKIKEKFGTNDITFEDCREVRGEDDWRSVAVNQALNISKAEWVWFTEQDFFITNKKEFWANVGYGVEQECDVVCMIEEGRYHPCCWFMKRSSLEKTSKDFSPIKDVSDHFSRIQNEVNEKNMLLMRIPSEYYHHMNGLSHNLRLLDEGLKHLIYHPKEFQKYLDEVAQLDE